MCARPARSEARRVRVLGGVVAAAALSGCVSLLPRQPPVQLYQFGEGPLAAASAPSAGSVIGRGQATLGVVLAQVSFPRAALGDEVLTTRGDQAAYIAGARWLTPAVLMFQEAAERAFQARSSRVRLIGRGELGAASALLRLDVDKFEARYPPLGGPPTVRVSLRATLARADGRTLLQQAFVAREPAAEDRVSAIVAAYDAAVTRVLAQAVDWTNAQTPVLARELDPDSPTVLPPRHPVRGLTPGLPPPFLPSLVVPPS